MCGRRCGQATIRTPSCINEVDVVTGILVVVDESYKGVRVLLRFPPHRRRGTLNVSLSIVDRTEWTEILLYTTLSRLGDCKGLWSTG